MIPVYHVGSHRTAPPACGGVAFSLKRSIPLSRLDCPADNVVKLDGSSPQRGEYLICGSCSAPVHPDWLSERCMAVS